MTTTVSILIAFGVYLLGMIGIGIWSMRQTKGADDFFLGGRGLSAPVAAMSAQASDMSGWLLMGLPGSVYALGTGQAWMLARYGVGNGFVLIMGRCVMVGHTEDVVGAEAFQSTALESCKGLRTRHFVCVKAIDV